MKARTAHRARWGLLVTTTAMGLALVGTGFSSYMGTRRASRDLIRARALDLGMAVRRTLRFAGPNLATFEDLVADSHDRGLRGLAVLVRDGPPIVTTGLDERALRHARAACAPSRRPLSVSHHEDLLLVAQPLRPGRPGRHGAKHRRQWEHGPPPGDACLVLVLDEAVTAPLVGRAGLTLTLSSIAAALLVALALFFLRASRRAETLSAELAQDRQLKALGEMSAVLGHEIRNPLASLKGHAQLLVEKLAEHPAQDSAQRVVAEAKRLESLTTEVLSFARTAELEVEPSNPVTIAQTSVETVDDPRVRLLRDEFSGTCLLDRHRLQQALVNLLRNALQAGPDDTEVLFALTLSEETLTFEVRDQGAGIPYGEEKRIFEPFITGRTRGTGLGLPIARRIIEGHGGTLTARNHAEGGALFTARLPRRTD